MQPPRSKFRRLLIPFLLLLPFFVMGVMTYRLERQQIVNRALIAAIEKNTPEKNTTVIVIATACEGGGSECPGLALLQEMDMGLPPMETVLSGGCSPRSGDTAVRTR